MSSKYVLKICKIAWMPITLALLIFYFSCLIPVRDLPNISIDIWGIPTDKLVHFCMYFSLSLVASISYIYHNRGHIIILKLIVFAILLPILYGGVIEIVQDVYFSRSGDVYDLLADTIGILASLPISFIYRRKLLNKEP